MLLMAADYVGAEITRFLCEAGEPITILVIDSQNRGGRNDEIVRLAVQSNKDVIIYSELEINMLAIQEEIAAQNVERGILAWWPYIISEEVIALISRGFINTHPSYLPYCRGKHPYFWSLVEEQPFGVTIHQVDTAIDAGPIISQRRIPIDWEDTGESLYLRSRDEMVALFAESYPLIAAGEIEPVLQGEGGTLHYGSEIEARSRIVLDQQYLGRELLNILRGRMFGGKGEAYFYDDGKKYAVSIKIEQIDEQQ